MLVPMLVVPMTDYNAKVPVIVGTYVIRQFKIPSEETDAIPDEWKTAFNSIISDRVGVVKITRKVTRQPNESRTITGLLRKNKNSDAALTEPVEAGIPNVTVCSRIVRADKPGNIARVPGRLYNISARVVTIQPKSEICNLEGITVFKADPIKEMEKNHEHSAQVYQKTIPVSEKKVSVDLEETLLTNEQKDQVQRFLAMWHHIFSQGPTDLGKTNLVGHEIHLESEQPFKEPYRKTPPALVQKVREHRREMLDIGAIRNRPALSAPML